MASGEVQAPPTFKLVLVGDGGTGKVFTVAMTSTRLTSALDDFCQTPFDGRIREKIHCHVGRRGASIGLYHRK